jgi:hypothetical protein
LMIPYRVASDRNRALWNYVGLAKRQVFNIVADHTNKLYPVFFGLDKYWKYRRRFNEERCEAALTVPKHFYPAT